MRSWLTLLALCAAGGGCDRQQIALKYQLGVDPSLVATVETKVSVDPADARAFFADQPFRSVATGVGYTVAPETEGGPRVMTVSQEAALGFKFIPQFVFTLLPPAEGDAPPLLISARALGPSRDTLGVAMPQQARFGAGAELAIVIGDQRCGDAVCAADQSCCDGACVRTAETAAHCGACGNACGANEGCAGGQCQCAGGSGCPAGRACCGDGCQDLANDPFNCGACGKACNTGETCSAGQCHCAGNGGNAGCVAGGLCCPGAGCSGTGTCPCGAAMCNASQLCCGGAGAMMCKNYLADSTNCGTCGNACAGPLMCQGGACKCSGVTCTGSDACCVGSGCRNLGNDVANCGMCGKSCVMGELCQSGACHCGSGNACKSDEICCGSSCVKAIDDNNNCGACGRRCGPQELCDQGNCKCAAGPGCSGSEKCCPGYSGAHGSCFDLSSDPQHCGACDKTCTSLESCIMGMCIQTSCAPDCALHMNQCVGGQCSCAGGAPCADTTCCASGCTNLKTDRNNCGVCGRMCSGFDLCCNGNCVVNSGSNCGACGVSCGPLSACCFFNGNYNCRLISLGCGTVPPDMASPPPDMSLTLSDMGVTALGDM